MEWSPTQAKMLAVLKDGRPHSKQELHACLNDELSTMANVYNHIKLINDKLRQSEQRILSENGHYRWVRLLIYSE